MRSGLELSMGLTESDIREQLGGERSAVTLTLDVGVHTILYLKSVLGGSGAPVRPGSRMCWR